MWLELIRIFRGDDPVNELGESFLEMVGMTHRMLGLVTPHVFDRPVPLEDRKQIYALDIEVNKLERSIRKRIVSHLAIRRTDIPHCLLLFSLVKDVERIGDYVKNLSEVFELGGARIPDGELRDEVVDIYQTTASIFDQTVSILAAENREEALLQLQTGRSTSQRCDRLVARIAASDLNAAETTSLVLLTRFTKRVVGHLVNVLSSIVMPLHKVDFYDEDSLNPDDEDE